MHHAFWFQGRAVNSRQVAISLPNDQNGVVMNWGNAEHWNIRGATIRGGWRHSCSHLVLERCKTHDDSFKMSTDTARLLALGGVKSSGSSKLMTPLQIERAKRMNPLIEIFGCNEPAFFAGHSYVAHMLSEDPIDRSRNNRYNLQVVRRPLPHSGFNLADLSDPERIAEFGEANRFRSQLETMSKRIVSLESRLSRKADEKLKKDLEGVYAELEKLTGKKFTSSGEVREFVQQSLQDMRDKGHSTVSEQTIPVGQDVIPIGTSMLHTVHVIGASNVGCGLLIDGISRKMFRNPIIGGRAASGCGGWVTTEYTVKRIDRVPLGNDKWIDQWVDDCSLVLTPEQHVEFHDAAHSKLKACHEEWLDCDISRFDFSYEALQRIANGNETVGDTQ